LRFNTAMRAVEKLLDAHGASLAIDGTGLAYACYRDDIRIGGPSSCAEHAALDAAIFLVKEKAKDTTA
jgi:hypothetical protein